MAALRNTIQEHRALSAIVAIAAVGVLLFASLGAARATDQPSFCRGACHEMAPYADAWSQGPHAGVSCIECHVDAGRTARLKHKVTALKEVWAHARGDVAFPRSTAAVVPNERCIRCHGQIQSSVAGFDHAAHATRGACQDCHASAGHQVSSAALQQAGVYAAGTQPDPLAGKVAVVDGGAANIAGHKAVPCSRCHDMARTGCPNCHTPRHADAAAKTAGDCTNCHRPGPTFAFYHPTATATTRCASCHTAPAKHRSGQCSTCHRQTGQSWAFTHPTSSAACQKCHTRPAKHRAGACASCHKKAGQSWAFKHPGSSTTCTRCHTRPANHRSGACSTCHRTGSWGFRHPGSSATCTGCHTRPAKHEAGACSSCHRTGSWKFRHPSSGARCTRCHSRPSGHASGACSNCHRTGASWAFRHSGSSRCSSCHRAPANHFGSSCASCHSPSRSWGSASFSHPRIRGGEHSYRSFACTKCHPNGYGSATCRRCHSSSTGPEDDDD